MSINKSTENLAKEISLMSDEEFEQNCKNISDSILMSNVTDAPCKRHKPVNLPYLEWFYKTERKTHPSFLRGWDVSDKR